MEKRIAPRCDRVYSFCDFDKEFDLQPLTVNKKRQIVFLNKTTNNTVYLTTEQFVDLYTNNLVRETFHNPSFFHSPKIQESTKLYVVARGWADFFITDNKNFYKPFIEDYENAVYTSCKSFDEAINFLKVADKIYSKSYYYAKTGLSEEENELLSLFKKLSKAERKNLLQNLSKL